MNETDRRIERARLGDMTATRDLVDSLAEAIGTVTATCTSLGWPMSEVLDVIACAVSIAIETFDSGSTPSFSDYAADCMARAIRGRIVQQPSAPN